MNKRDELKLLVSIKEPDIVQITETLPKYEQSTTKDDTEPIDYSKEFDILPGYNIYINKILIGVLQCTLSPPWM